MLIIIINFRTTCNRTRHLNQIDMPIFVNSMETEGIGIEEILGC